MRIFRLLKRLVRVLKKEGLRGILLRLYKRFFPGADLSIFEYHIWLKRSQVKGSKSPRRREINSLAYKPKISIIMPVYNVAEAWLHKCIGSVQAQSYPDWELCIVDDASTDPKVKPVLEQYRLTDSRIKVCYHETNRHISAASNSALELASGEYIALLDNDDELAKHALFEIVKLLNAHPDADMIYSDEDKISEKGIRCYPCFKPQWSPDLFTGYMYTGHLAAYRTDLVRKLGGFRQGFEGSQDYDLVLRLTEVTKNIYHLPKILYHWRMIPQSTAVNPGAKNYAYTAGEKAVQEALDRRGEGGWMEPVSGCPGKQVVHYPIKGNPLISLIIPNASALKGPARFLNDLAENTAYKNIELIFVVSDSSEIEPIKHAAARYYGADMVKFIPKQGTDTPANVVNRGASVASGELLLLFNANLKPVNNHWLEEMAGQAQRASIGAVGARILTENERIKHAGMILVGDDVAGYSHCGLVHGWDGYFSRMLVISNCASVSSDCLMVRKQHFLEVGGLDEELDVAFHDVDFCLKLLRKGLLNVALPHVIVKVSKDEIPETNMKALDKDKALIVERWGNILFDDPFYNPNFNIDPPYFTLPAWPRNVENLPA